MTVQASLTVNISMYSGVSESLLNQHLNHFLEEMQHSIKSMKDRSWYKSIASSWDENHPVEISLDITKA